MNTSNTLVTQKGHLKEHQKSVHEGFKYPWTVLGWQSEAICGFVVELIVGYDGKFLREYNTFTVLCV